MSFEHCEHNFIDNVCTECGLIIEKYFEDRNILHDKTKDKSNILDSITGIPREVLIKARQNIIKKQEETGKKVRNDANNTFISIYEAYLECGYKNFIPTDFIDQLGLARSQINCCLKKASDSSLVPSIHSSVKGIKVTIVIISPLVYVDKYIIINNLEEYKEDILNMTKFILKEKDILYSSRPSYVACAIIKLFCDDRGINTKSFGKLNGISENALKKSIKDVEEFF